MDRNIASRQLPTPEPPSLSARRAWIEIANFCKNRFCPTVALRKESVDRNSNNLWYGRRMAAVALRKESVDRNRFKPAAKWAPCVALRKESVDRNTRRRIVLSEKPAVALRKESVDRNCRGAGRNVTATSRSPQGERG